ncbi:MAG: hypothetical protein ACXADA_20495 [Candidatus Hodarchaeales archaeon]
MLSIDESKNTEKDSYELIHFNPVSGIGYSKYGSKWYRLDITNGDISTLLQLTIFPPITTLDEIRRRNVKKCPRCL